MFGGRGVQHIVLRHVEHTAELGGTTHKKLYPSQINFFLTLIIKRLFGEGGRRDKGIESVYIQLQSEPRGLDRIIVRKCGCLSDPDFFLSKKSDTDPFFPFN